MLLDSNTGMPGHNHSVKVIDLQIFQILDKHKLRRSMLA